MYADELERRVQQELTRLDPDLFLDKLYSPFGYIYYAVRNNIGSGEEPLTVIEWRDNYGPLPLSMGLVDQVRRQEGDIRDAIRNATINNVVRKEMIRQKRHQEQDTIIEEFMKSSRKLGSSGPWSPGKDVWAWSNKKQ